MLEAVVGVALRAILASVVLGGVLAALVLLATRTLALTAATRHALWTTALIATALMPLAGVGVSVARATAAPAPVATTLGLTSGTTSAVPAPGGLSRDASPVTKDRANGAASSSSAAPAAAATSWLAERLAPGRWTLPRLSRALATGLVGIWALGALIGLIGLAASIVRVRGLKRRSSPLDGPLADELPWLTEIGPGREIYLRLSFETETPVAIGFRRPVILIPTELATADGLAAIEQLILHEHAHLRRYDDWTNLVQRAIERIFWFNPVVWLVGRRIALEREIASDDAVVEKTGEAHAYAISLWRLAREMRMPEHAVVAPGALLTRKQITVRIEQLLDKKRARLHRSPSAALGVALASLAAVAFVATSAPAVELPAVADAPAAAAPAAWHRAFIATNTHPPSVRGITKLHVATLRGTPSAPGAQFNAGFGMSAAQSASETKPNGAAKLPAPGAAKSQFQQQTIEYTVRGSSPLTVVAGNGGKARGTASATTRAAASAKPHELGEPPQMLGVKVPAVVPPVPAAPPVPNTAPVAPVTVKVRTLRALSAEQIARLQAAAERAAAHASHAGDAAEFGPLVAKSMQEVLATLPREIAQESSTTRQSRMDGVKLSRELVASCVACSFRNADLRGIDLHGIKINADDFSGADFRGANLSGAQLVGVSLAHANLSNADLRNAELNGVELRDANLDGALLDGIKLIGVSVKRTSLRGTTLRSVIANCTGCDFGKMDLHGQDLHGISLNGANLSHADLHDANLSGVRFSGVDLSYANLAGADLTNASLSGCNLTGIELRGARTTGMTMHGSTLDG